MQAGKLRHRITIQAPTITQDPESGEALPGWSDWATVWASIEPLSAREFIAAQAGQSEITARVVIRHRAGVLPAMRVVHSGKIYNIHGVLPDMRSGLEYLTMPVSEGGSDG